MYEIILILLIILCFSSLIYFLYKNIKIKRKAREILEEKLKLYNEKKKQEFDNIEKEFERKINYLRDKFNEREAEYNKIINQTKVIIQEEEEKKNLILSQKQEIIDKELNEYKIKKEQQMNNDFRTEEEKLKTELKIKTDELVKQFENFKNDIFLTEQGYNDELFKIKQELEDYRLRRAVVNEAIRREEEAANEIDFHRIILSETDKDDINYLLSIEEKIHNKDLLHKLIWSEYLQKPFNQMLNNIFGSKVPKNVIYCIENIKTHKKYIGKTSAEVSKRWTEHIKSSLNIGGIKKQKIHEALFKHWDEYTFSILEVVTKETLNEKEKYYISFFETDKYGFNSKSGG